MVNRLRLDIVAGVWTTKAGPSGGKSLMDCCLSLFRAEESFRGVGRTSECQRQAEQRQRWRRRRTIGGDRRCWALTQLKRRRTEVGHVCAA